MLDQTVERSVSAAVGLFLVWLALRDVFQAVIVPRAVNRTLRISAMLTRALWQVWPSIAYRRYATNDDAREDFLGTFAPFSMIALLAAWVLTLVLGYGFLFFALQDAMRPPMHALPTAFYFAGTSILTIGYGDVVATGTAARFVALAAGASGLGVVAVVTSYLFAVFGAFQRREAFVVIIGNRSGFPPSGSGLLVVHAELRLTHDLPRIFCEAQQWAAEVMESHLAYPILSFFRSSHDYESWIGTLGSLLDAAVLLMTAVEGDHGQARVFYGLGTHVAYDLTHYYGLPASRTSPGVERREFDEACGQLAAAGYDVRNLDSAWREFSERRAAYAGPLNAMARWLEIPPLRWVGDRTILANLGEGAHR